MAAMVGGSKCISTRAVALLLLLCLVSISPSYGRSIATARELMRWMKANGATVNVDVVDLGNGRFGTVAAKDLKVSCSARTPRHGVLRVILCI